MKDENAGTVTISIERFKELEKKEKALESGNMVVKTVLPDIRLRGMIIGVQTAIDEYKGENEVITELTKTINEQGETISKLQKGCQKMELEVQKSSCDSLHSQVRSDMYLKITKTWWFRLFAGKKYSVA